MPQRYFQVIPLYLGDDDALVRYFKEYKAEVDAVTGQSLQVSLPYSVTIGNAANVVSAMDSKRYPGLKLKDLACLWVEGVGEHFIIRLPNSANEVKQVLRVLSASAKEAKSFRELEEKYMADDPLKPAGAGPQVPAWFAKAGYATGLLTLLFFMALVVAGVLGHEVPQGTHMLVVFVISLGLALASSFIGGNAAANGSLPFPFAKERPIAFTVGGGIAVFVVALLIGYYAYVKT